MLKEVFSTYVADEAVKEQKELEVVSVAINLAEEKVYCFLKTKDGTELADEQNKKIEVNVDPTDFVNAVQAALDSSSAVEVKSKLKK